MVREAVPHQGIVNTIAFGDCRAIMHGWANEGVRAQTCVTSPPYFGLRDYETPPLQWPSVEYRPIAVPGVPAIVIPAGEASLGNELTPEAFIGHMVLVFRAVRDLLAEDGTLWLNIGDAHVAGRSGGIGERSRVTSLRNHHATRRAQEKHGQSHYRRAPGLQRKDLIGIPWRLAFALQADGWILRQDLIWRKPNPMPESVRDRCTKAHEYLFLFAKTRHYFLDREALLEPAVEARPSKTGRGAFRGQGRHRDVVSGIANRPGRELGDVGRSGMRNRRSVWNIATRPFAGAHFATFPPDLVEPCIRMGSRPGDVVLDPFMGSATTAGVACKLGRRYLGCELNPAFGELHAERIRSIIAGG